MDATAHVDMHRACCNIRVVTSFCKLTWPVNRIFWEASQAMAAFASGKLVLRPRIRNCCDIKIVYRRLDTSKSCDNVKTELGIDNVAVTDIITNSSNDLAKTTLV